MKENVLSKLIVKRKYQSVENSLRYILLVAFLLILTFSCKKKSNLQDFYDDIDKTLSIETKRKIIECSNFDCIKMQLVNNKVNFPIPKLIIDSLTMHGIFSNIDQEVLSIYSYKNYKDGKGINWNTAVVEYKKEKSINDSVENEQFKREKRAIEAFSLSYYNKVKDGDTINCIFPLIPSGKKKYIAFTRSENPESTPEKLFLQCKVMKKVKRKQQYETFCCTEYIFELAILEIDDRKDLIDSDQSRYIKGRIFNLPLDIAYPFAPYKIP